MQSSPDSDMNKWYIRSPSGDTRGPFTPSQMKEWMQGGKMSDSTLVSRVPAGPFQPISQLKNIKPTATEPPPLPVNIKSEDDSPDPSNFLLRWTILMAVVTTIVLGGLIWAQRSTRVAREQARFQPPEPVVSNSPASSQSTTQSTPSTSSSAATPSTFEEVISSAEKSVCVIRGQFSTGSGFIFENDQVMTNRHVIANLLTDEIEVLFPSHNKNVPLKTKAQIVYEDPQIDVAILRISPAPSSPPLEFERETRNRFRRGMDIISIGSPGVGDLAILENAVSRGLLSSESVIEGVEYYQVSISINPRAIAPC